MRRFSWFCLQHCCEIVVHLLSSSCVFLCTFSYLYENTFAHVCFSFLQRFQFIDCEAKQSGEVMRTQSKRTVSFSNLVKRWNVVRKAVSFTVGLSRDGDVRQQQHVCSVFQQRTFAMFYAVFSYPFLCNFVINQFLALADTFFLITAHERTRIKKLFYFF